MEGHVKDLTVIIPVKDEPHEIANQIKRKLARYGAEVIIVDDGSRDPNPKAFQLKKSNGYGGAILAGVMRSNRKYILTMDGDSQHTAGEALKLYKAFELMGKNVDMLVGARRLKHERFLRLFGRKFLNTIASFLACYWLSDLNSGLRIFRRDLALNYAPILCRTFSFTTSLTMSMKCDNYRVEWFPVNVGERRVGTSHVRVIKHGIITLKYILWIGFALRTRKIRALIRPLYAKYRK